jgi:UDP-2,3-diacylglucosamine pyrophosphatase LpxH
VPCYFIHGNRDFLLGNAMRAKAACSFCRKRKCSICMVARC